MNYPLISILIPCRNEELFISGCVTSLLNQDYPSEKVEILIVDGLSTDGSLRLLKEIVEKNVNVLLIENPGKIFPVAVNLGISRAKGDYIFIAGAHAIYPSNYISECIKYSLKYDADNIGGIIETVPLKDNFLGRLITTVLSSPFGVGNSKFRTGSTEIIETDTVFGGCYKSNVFSKYGMFNENLVSTSDYEFNRRIKKAGARILLVPEVNATYYTRSNLAGFLKNNIRNGFWAIYPILFTDHFPVSFRHLVPLIFTLSLIATICLGLISEYFIYLFFTIIILYLIVSLFYSVKAAKDKVGSVFALPVLFISLHLTYGIGSLWGVINVIYKKFSDSLKP
jgi:glycosyltransferase involved in cell wall biosynthesis